MKKSGKLVLWITSACLIASLGACQNSDNTDANTDTISITETSAQASDETQASDTAQEYEKGSWDGNIYTNTGMDLTFTLPDGWMSASDENIAQTVGGNADGVPVDRKDALIQRNDLIIRGHVGVVSVGDLHIAGAGDIVITARVRRGDGYRR